jgi:DNA-binding SARP family transcriptional activator
MLQDLLQRGIAASVYPQFCQQYGLKQLGMVLSAKTAVPELHIQVLGGLRLSLPGGEESGTATTFIKGQRRLLGLLLRSESLEVSQAVVQDELWPDVPEDKARGRFDTLMARLRKVLKPIVHPHAVKNYVAVSKGVVALNHCRVDSYQFCRLVDEGLVHLKNGEFWQAGNSFYPALRLWQGAVALELLDLGEGGRFAEEPGRRLLEMVLQWCPVLFGIDRHDEALRVCVLAWQFNHENSEMARLLYGLYVQSGFTLKARQTLDEFEKALGSLGVDAEKRHQLRAEIEEVSP